MANRQRYSRPVKREREHGLSESAGLDQTGERTWEWTVDTGGRELDTMALGVQWPDFFPGFVDGLWYVTGVAADSLAPGSDFIKVVQTWRRVEYENPLAVPFRWTAVESTEIEIPATRDIDGRPLCTRAGEPILGLTYSQKVWKLRGTRNIAGIPLWLADYGKSTNADRVRIGTVSVPPNCLQLQGVQIGDEDDSVKVAGRTIIFRPMNLEFWWNPSTWTTEVLHMGFYELQNTAARGKPIWTPVRVDSDTPVFLNDLGQRPRHADGTPKALLEPSEIKVLHFNMNDRKPYSKLIR